MPWTCGTGSGSLAPMPGSGIVPQLHAVENNNHKRARPSLKQRCLAACKRCPYLYSARTRFHPVLHLIHNYTILRTARERIRTRSTSGKMATLSPDSGHVPRRESSSRPRNSSSSRRPSRPRLLRACATEPSITTSNSCSGVLTATNTNRRATELLSRVAVSNSNSEGLLRMPPSSPSSTRSFGLETEEGTDRRLSETAQRTMLHPNSQQRSSPPNRRRPQGNRGQASLTPQEADSACYFSFPSFDTWEEQPDQNDDKTY